jgi:hypothetical protein
VRRLVGVVAKRANSLPAVLHTSSGDVACTRKHVPSSGPREPLLTGLGNRPCLLFVLVPPFPGFVDP